MDELSNYKNTDRVIFHKGEQTKFLSKALEMSFLTWEQFSHFLGINPRLLRYYRSEEYSLSIKLLKRIMELSDIKFPSRIKIKDQFWSKAEAGKKGGLAIIKKYGKIPIDEEERKNVKLKRKKLHVKK